MKVSFLKCLIFLLLLTLVIGGCSYSPIMGGDNEMIDEDPATTTRLMINTVRKIVVLKEDAPSNEVAELVTICGGQVLRELPSISALVVSLPGMAADRAFDAIYSHTSVLRIDDDLIMHIAVKPDKPGKPGGGDNGEEQPPEVLPWGIDRIDAEPDWGHNGGAGVTVGILDTGIDLSHPDLQGNIAGSINIINPRKSARDDHGHGTHVAGTIAAIDNEIGVIGVAPLAQLYGVKVLDRRGSGYLSDILAGIEWCVTNNIDIINMSLGASSGNQSFLDAINAAHLAGTVIVCAAGNENGPVLYPAAYDKTIAVGATDEFDEIASFSNFGPEVDLVAPGVMIFSTFTEGTYAYKNGTSMATPHVTGVAALILNKTPELPPDEVKNTLKSTAESLGEYHPHYQGAGLVDAHAAVM